MTSNTLSGTCSTSMEATFLEARCNSVSYLDASRTTWRPVRCRRHNSNNVNTVIEEYEHKHNVTLLTEETRQEFEDVWAGVHDVPFGEEELCKLIECVHTHPRHGLTALSDIHP